MNEIPYDYSQFQQRAARNVRRARGRRDSLAAFTCCALALIGSAQWLTRGSAVRASFSNDAEGQVGSRGATNTLSREAATQLLARLPGDPAIVAVASGMAVARLEDRIALLDDQLNDAQFDGDTLLRIHRLHSERVQLVDSLTRVRYAEQLAASTR